jgi:hypothetical protein
MDLGSPVSEPNVNKICVKAAVFLHASIKTLCPLLVEIVADCGTYIDSGAIFVDQLQLSRLAEETTIQRLHVVQKNPTGLRPPHLHAESTDTSVKSQQAFPLIQ